jgi:SAM-dependent methyltransferase
VSNNDPLTAEEFDAYRPNRIALERLEGCRRRLELSKAEFRVVDWGCGRGKTVLWLREQGYDAYGVDVDSRPFANGVDLFRRKGYRFEECVRPLDRDGNAPFADGFFHFVLSDQVLEHIADLAPALAEMRRVTTTSGEGFHLFPPHRRIVEPHLYMPLVHWLPKGIPRKWAIGLCVLVGVEPHWWPKHTIGFREKLRTYYEFSVNDTFYRPHAAVRSAFAEAGMAAECIDVCNGGFRRALTQAVPFLGPESRATRYWYKNFAADLGLVTRVG